MLTSVQKEKQLRTRMAYLRGIGEEPMWYGSFEAIVASRLGQARDRGDLTQRAQRKSTEGTERRKKKAGN
jgi:hypothetical protein